jgi:hypothetical protein
MTGARALERRQPFRRRDREIAESFIMFARWTTSRRLDGLPHPHEGEDMTAGTKPTCQALKGSRTLRLDECLCAPEGAGPADALATRGSARSPGSSRRRASRGLCRRAAFRSAGRMQRCQTAAQQDRSSSIWRASRPTGSVCLLGRESASRRRLPTERPAASRGDRRTLALPRRNALAFAPDGPLLPPMETTLTRAGTAHLAGQGGNAASTPSKIIADGRIAEFTNTARGVGEGADSRPGGGSPGEGDAGAERGCPGRGLRADHRRGRRIRDASPPSDRSARARGHPRLTGRT